MTPSQSLLSLASTDTLSWAETRGRTAHTFARSWGKEDLSNHLFLKPGDHREGPKTISSHHCGPWKLSQIIAHLLNKVQALCIIHPVDGFPVYSFPESQEQTDQTWKARSNAPMSTENRIGWEWLSQDWRGFAGIGLCHAWGKKIGYTRHC